MRFKSILNVYLIIPTHKVKLYLTNQYSSIISVCCLVLVIDFKETFLSDFILVKAIDFIIILILLLLQ